ncbi:glutamate receptor-like [Penaeus japonicus]|uniref:glutamate receptor-like n=1 Tax=Penaeus japonicus TaxID=27405 RepID=UPI001C70F418|nr:glutamate receptor-like [Penaeus japonicus]
MGILTRGEADMSGVVFSVTEDRHKSVDFSVPLFVNEHILAYTKPTFQPDIVGFMKPYSVSLWIVLLLSMVMVCAGLILAQRKRFAIVSSQNTGLETTEPRDTVWYSSFWTFGSFLAQSIPWQPEGISVQLIAGLWLLMMLIVNTVYRSNLKAMLILPRLDLPFDTLSELVETNIKTYVSPGSFIHRTVMKSPPGSPLQRLQKQMDLHLDGDLALYNVAAGKTAVLIDRNTIMYAIDEVYKATKSCPLYVASERLYSDMSLALAFPRGSKLKDKVDPILSALKESGILGHLFNHQVRHAKRCLDNDAVDTNRRPLELQDFYGLLCIYAGGIVLAIISFIIEVGLNPCRNQPRTL